LGPIASAVIPINQNCGFQFLESQNEGDICGRAMFEKPTRRYQRWLLSPPGVEQSPEFPLKKPNRCELLQMKTD
jgi:hypothetical protein